MTAGATTAAVVEAALDVTAVEEAVSVVLEGSIAAARPVAGGAAMGVVAAVEGDALTGVAAATEADAGPRVAAATLTDVAAIERDAQVGHWGGRRGCMSPALSSSRRASLGVTFRSSSPLGYPSKPTMS